MQTKRLKSRFFCVQDAAPTNRPHAHTAAHKLRSRKPAIHKAAHSAHSAHSFLWSLARAGAYRKLHNFELFFYIYKPPIFPHRETAHRILWALWALWALNKINGLRDAVLWARLWACGHSQAKQFHVIKFSIHAANERPGLSGWTLPRGEGGKDPNRGR